MAGNTDGVKAGRAYVEVGTDNQPLDVGLSRASQRLKAFGKSAMGVGAILAGVGIGIGTGLFAAAKSFADSGSQLADMSQRTGDTAANLSAIGFAAKQSGSDIESLEGGLKKMSITIAGALAGEKAAVKLLKQLGLSAADLKGKMPTEQLTMLADKLAGITDKNTKIDLVQSIFGKAGVGLIPLLNEGSAGIARLTAEAKRLGLVMSDEDVAAADALGDSLDKLYASLGAVKNRVGAALAPEIIKLADALSNTASTVGKFIAENKQLIIGAGVTAAALVALGLVIVGIGVAATVAGYALAGLGIVMAVIASPVVLIVAALAAGVLAFLHFTDAGQKAARILGKHFKWLLDDINAIPKAIEQAMGGNNQTNNRGAIERNWDRMGMTDDQKAEKRRLLGWVDQAKIEAGKAGADSAGRLAMDMKSPAASARFSSAAASSIAGAVNSQMSIPAQQLAETKKANALLEKLVKNKPVTIQEVS